MTIQCFQKNQTKICLHKPKNEITYLFALILITTCEIYCLHLLCTCVWMQCIEKNRIFSMMQCVLFVESAQVFYFKVKGFCIMYRVQFVKCIFLFLKPFTQCLPFYHLKISQERRRLCHFRWCHINKKTKIIMMTKFFQKTLSAETTQSENEQKSNKNLVEQK